MKKKTVSKPKRPSSTNNFKKSLITYKLSPEEIYFLNSKKLEKGM